MTVRYLRLAESDLNQIAAYTIQQFGASQADRYLAELERCAHELAATPTLGRSCEAVRSGLRRFEQGSHVLFYLADESGIVIARILHKSMLPDLHEFDHQL